MTIRCRSDSRGGETAIKAIRVAQHGSPEVLELAELPIPGPNPSQLLVRLEVVGVNFIDVKMRSGDYPHELPFTPGIEGAGVVVTGHDSLGIAEGTRVVSPNLIGAYAEYAVVDATRIAPIANDLDSDLATAATVHGLTAHYLTQSIFPLEKGDSCLVHAAAGGVGLMLVQLARRRGARVIGTVSTREKADLAVSAGADDVIIYTESDFESELRRLEPEGVRVVYDSVGKATVFKSLRCLAPRGCLLCFGESSGAVDPILPRALGEAGSVFLTRSNLIDYTRTQEELQRRVKDVFDLVTWGELQIRLHAKVPLNEAREAHEMLEQRRTMGKILLVP